jgi:hypothetical protein
MPARKTHDLTIKTGEYTDKTGATRARTRNVGALYQRDDGSVFVALDSLIVTMEAQYLANPDRADRVMISAYAPRDEKPAAPAPAPAQNARPAAERPAAPAKPAPRVDFDDEIPF